MTQRTITTEAEGLELPDGSVCLCADRAAWQKGFQGEWYRVADGRMQGPNHVPYPALVLWEPLP